MAAATNQQRANFSNDGARVGVQASQYNAYGDTNIQYYVTQPGTSYYTVERSANTHLSLPENRTKACPCSTVPFRRDNNFVYRNALADIGKRCAQPAARLALVGLGGVGKSQLAIEYAYRVRDASPETWVFWVHASSTTRIEEGYRRIAEATNLPGLNDPKVDILRLVRAWLCDESNGRWIMIVDNADDLSLLTDLSEDILPESSNGSVLVTSRRREAAYELVGEDDNIIKIEPMSKDDALALFQQKLEDEFDDAGILELLQHLDYMPLAISQAAAYIRQRRPRVTILTYLKDLQLSAIDKASLLKVAIKDRRRDGKASNSILATWQVSFDFIRIEKSSAARLLSLMSFFDRQGIPEELIASGYGEGGNVLNFEEDIMILRDFSIITIGVNSAVFEMHRLMQFATRQWLKENKDLEKWKERYITIMAKAFPSGNYENWATCRTLFPHAELMLEYQPVNEGFLQRWTATLNNVGGYAQEQGNYGKAEAMHRRALIGYEKVLGPEHPDTLTSVNNLGSVLESQSKYEEAEAMHRRALKAREKVLGPEHPNTLTSVNNLGSVLERQGKYEEAEAMNRRALKAKEKVLGPEHPSTLTSVSNLGSVLSRQGKYEEAEAMHRRDLLGSEKVLEPEHPNTLTSVNNLGSVLSRQGKYEEAEAMHRRALKAREKVLGPEHPNTLTSVNNLGSVLESQGKYEEAEAMHRRALKAREKVLGPEHPDTLTSVSNLGSVLESQGKYEEAEAMHRRNTIQVIQHKAK